MGALGTPRSSAMKLATTLPHKPADTALSWKLPCGFEARKVQHGRKFHNTSPLPRNLTCL